MHGHGGVPGLLLPGRGVSLGGESFVPSPTVWATPLAAQSSPTFAAAVARASPQVARQREPHVCHEQGVAHVVERGDGEHDVAHAAHGCQTAEVEQGLWGGQQVAHVVEGGYRHDEHGPHRHEEHAQHRGHGEGVERGVEVEVLPQPRGEHLYGGVERSRRCHDDAEQRGVEGVDVVEVDDVSLAAQQLPDEPPGAEEPHDGEEHYEVRVGEVGYELGYGVVGHDLRQHAALARPPERRRVVGKLHPHRVDGVGRHYADVRHHHVVALAQAERVGVHAGNLLLGLLQRQRQAVAPDHEVVVVGVMVGREERQRVDGTLVYAEVLGQAAGVHAVLVARRKDEARQRHDPST